MQVTGLRWKRFIPATTGGCGADIVVVTERWYSPELKIQLLARIIDPRAGDTSEVVTNLDRGEPDPSEFQIPADYKIETVVARVNGLCPVLVDIHTRVGMHKLHNLIDRRILRTPRPLCIERLSSLA